MPFLTINAELTTFIVGVLLPLVVGIVTKLETASWVKSWMLAVLSLVSGIIITSTQETGIAVVSKATVITAFFAWVTAMASYYGFLKPTQISPTINRRTAALGI